MSQIKGKPLAGYEKVREPKKPRPKGRERFEDKKDEALRAYVRGLPCLICLGTPVQCAHVTSKGAAGGDWDNLLPLCVAHHAEQHRIGIRSFEYRYQVRLKAAARQVTAQYVGRRKHG